MRGPGGYRNYSPRARRIAWLLDLAAAPAAPLFRRAAPRGRPPDVPDSILVARLDHIGDVLMTTPAIAALRTAHPGARIDVLASAQGRAALVGNPHVDRVFEAEAPWYEPRRGRSLPPLRSARAVARELRARAYDWAFDMRGDPRVVFFYLLPAARRRFGFSGLGLESLLTDTVPYDRSRGFLDLSLDLARTAGAVPITRRPVFAVSEERRRGAEVLLREAVKETSRPVALLAPGSNRPQARWAAERFARVADGLAAGGFATALVGSSADREATSSVVSAAKSRISDLTGRIDLAGLAALLERASVLVTNDSAPAHVAAAVGCPAVVVFGPSDPAVSFPYEDGLRFVSVSSPFDHPRPCYDPRCPSDHGLASIDPEKVLKRALAAARLAPAGRAGEEAR